MASLAKALAASPYCYIGLALFEIVVRFCVLIVYSAVPANASATTYRPAPRGARAGVHCAA